MNHFLPYRTTLLIFGAALILRLFFLPSWILPGEEVKLPESVAFDGYYEIVEHLRAGDGFTRITEGPLAGPDSVRTPLYPLLILALFTVFGSYKAIFILQTFMGAASAVIAWLIAKEFLNERGAKAVGLLAALEPFTAYLSGIILTETVFSFIFLLALWLLLRFLRERHLWLLVTSSLLLGTSMLVKPTVQYLPALILFVLAYSYRFRFQKQWFRDTAILMTIFILCVAPWAYRNYVTFGTTMLVVQPVSNLFTYLVPSTIAFETGQTYKEAVADFFAREGVTSIEEINLGNAAHFQERALEELKKHPKGLALSLGMTIFTFFTHDTYAMILERFGIEVSYAHPPLTTLLTSPVEAVKFAAHLATGPELWVLLGRAAWIVLSLLSFAGVIMYALKQRISPAFLLVIGTVAYFAVTTAVIGLAINGRFRNPVNPIIFIFAVYALQHLKTILKKRPDGNKAVAGPYLLPVGK